MKKYKSKFLSQCFAIHKEFIQQLKSGITQDSISSIYLIAVPFSVRTVSIPLVSKPEIYADVGLDAADKREVVIDDMGGDAEMVDGRVTLNLSSPRVSLCFYLSSLIHRATASISITTVRIRKKTCKEYTCAGAGWDSFIDHTLYDGYILARKFPDLEN